MNKKRSSILVLVLLLVIGFAAISTTLVINGTLNVNGNAEDFDVYFSAATITDGGTVSGIGSKTLTFSTHTLKNIYDISILDYTVYNNSTEYDADVTIKCVASTESDYFTVTSTFDGTTATDTASTTAITMAAQAKKNGKIVIVQTKAYAEDTDLSVAYTCTIVAKPTSRTTIEENVCKVGTGNWILTDDDCDGTADIGELITVGTESFYVISNDGTNIKALAQYNLYVGGYDDDTSVTAYTDATGLQDSTMLGWTQSMADPYDPYYPQEGITAFSSTSNTYSGSIVEGYVNTYVDTLNNKMNANVTAGTLITTDELVVLGCNMSDQVCFSSSYSWLYSTSYWTSSASDPDGVWGVATTSGLSDLPYDAEFALGVRPVITISVDELK